MLPGHWIYVQYPILQVDPYYVYLPSLSLRQPGIEVACEGIAIRLSERRRTSADIAAGAHGVHEISHGEHSANGIRGVALSPGVERLASLGDDLSGERNISRDDQVSRRHALDDFSIGHIEPRGHLNRAQARNARNLQGLIGDQRHRDTNALGRAKQNVLDDIRASICVDPNNGSRHVRPSINARASARAIYTSKQVLKRRESFPSPAARTVNVWPYVQIGLSYR